MRDPWEVYRRGEPDDPEEAEGEEPHPHAGDFTLFDQLASEVEHLALEDPWPRGNDWPRWGFSTMYKRAEHLRSCHLITNVGAGFAAVRGHVPVSFPVLEELKLADISRTLERTERASWVAAMEHPLWLAAPVLKRLYATPRIAQKLAAPSVDTAYLVIHGPNDLRRLSQVLASWPNLECLTIDDWGDEEAYDVKWKSKVLQKLVSILSPSKRGRVYCPRLHHVGIIFQGPRRICRDPLDRKPINWAAMPWSYAECFDYRTFFKEEDWYPDLGAEIVRMERDRRRLSEGGEVRSGRSGADGLPITVRGPRAALQSIKLGGVNVEPPTWDTLLDDTLAEVTCHPIPYRKGQ